MAAARRKSLVHRPGRARGTNTHETVKGTAQGQGNQAEPRGTKKKHKKKTKKNNTNGAGLCRGPLPHRFESQALLLVTAGGRPAHTYQKRVMSLLEESPAHHVIKFQQMAAQSALRYQPARLEQRRGGQNDFPVSTGLGDMQTRKRNKEEKRLKLKKGGPPSPHYCWAQTRVETTVGDFSNWRPPPIVPGH